MTPSPQERGAELLHSRRERTQRIRRSIAGGAVGLFLALWLLVFGRLTAGHDPALAATSSQTKTATKQAQSVDSSGSSASVTQDSTQPSAVTTSQS